MSQSLYNKLTNNAVRDIRAKAKTDRVFGFAVAAVGATVDARLDRKDGTMHWHELPDMAHQLESFGVVTKAIETAEIRQDNGYGFSKDTKVFVREFYKVSEFGVIVMQKLGFGAEKAPAKTATVEQSAHTIN